MARKPQPPPPQPPSIPPERGIELLQRQREKGAQFLAGRPDRAIDDNDYRAWYSTTHAFLVDSFGSDSPNIIRFGRAGGANVSYPGETEEWYEERRTNILGAQLKILDSCVEQLEARVEPGAAPGAAP